MPRPPREPRKRSPDKKPESCGRQRGGQNQGQRQTGGRGRGRIVQLPMFIVPAPQLMLELMSSTSSSLASVGGVVAPPATSTSSTSTTSTSTSSSCTSMALSSPVSGFLQPPPRPQPQNETRTPSPPVSYSQTQTTPNRYKQSINQIMPPNYPPTGGQRPGQGQSPGPGLRQGQGQLVPFVPRRQSPQPLTQIMPAEPGERQRPPCYPRCCPPAPPPHNPIQSLQSMPSSINTYPISQFARRAELLVVPPPGQGQSQGQLVEPPLPQPHPSSYDIFQAQYEQHQHHQFQQQQIQNRNRNIIHAINGGGGGDFGGQGQGQGHTVTQHHLYYDSRPRSNIPAAAGSLRQQLTGPPPPIYRNGYHSLSQPRQQQQPYFPNPPIEYQVPGPGQGSGQGSQKSEGDDGRKSVEYVSSQRHIIKPRGLQNLIRARPPGFQPQSHHDQQNIVNHDSNQSSNQNRSPPRPYQHQQQVFCNGNGNRIATSGEPFANVSLANLLSGGEGDNGNSDSNNISLNYILNNPPPSESSRGEPPKKSYFKKANRGGAQGQPGSAADQGQVQGQGQPPVPPPLPPPQAQSQSQPETKKRKRADFNPFQALNLSNNSNYLNRDPTLFQPRGQGQGQNNSSRGETSATSGLNQAHLPRNPTSGLGLVLSHSNSLQESTLAPGERVNPISCPSGGGGAVGVSCGSSSSSGGGGQGSGGNYNFIGLHNFLQRLRKYCPESRPEEFYITVEPGQGSPPPLIFIEEGNSEGAFNRGISTSDNVNIQVIIEQDGSTPTPPTPARIDIDESTVDLSKLNYLSQVACEVGELGDLRTTRQQVVREILTRNPNLESQPQPPQPQPQPQPETQPQGQPQEPEVGTQKKPRKEDQEGAAAASIGDKFSGHRDSDQDRDRDSDSPIVILASINSSTDFPSTSSFPISAKKDAMGGFIKGGTGDATTPTQNPGLRIKQEGMAQQEEGIQVPILLVQNPAHNPDSAAKGQGSSASAPSTSAGPFSTRGSVINIPQSPSQVTGVNFDISNPRSRPPSGAGDLITPEMWRKQSTSSATSGGSGSASATVTQDEVEVGAEVEVEGTIPPNLVSTPGTPSPRGNNPPNSIAFHSGSSRQWSNHPSGGPRPPADFSMLTAAAQVAEAVDRQQSQDRGQGQDRSQGQNQGQSPIVAARVHQHPLKGRLYPGFVGNNPNGGARQYGPGGRRRPVSPVQDRVDEHEHDRGRERDPENMTYGPGGNDQPNPKKRRKSQPTHIILQGQPYPEGQGQPPSTGHNPNYSRMDQQGHHQGHTHTHHHHPQQHQHQTQTQHQAQLLHQQQHQAQLQQLQHQQHQHQLHLQQQHHLQMQQAAVAAAAQGYQNLPINLSVMQMGAAIAAMQGVNYTSTGAPILPSHAQGQSAQGHGQGHGQEQGEGSQHGHDYHKSSRRNQTSNTMMTCGGQMHTANPGPGSSGSGSGGSEFNPNSEIARALLMTGPIRQHYQQQQQLHQQHQLHQQQSASYGRPRSGGGQLPGGLLSIGPPPPPSTMVVQQHHGSGSGTATMTHSGLNVGGLMMSSPKSPGPPSSCRFQHHPRGLGGLSPVVSIPPPQPPSSPSSPLPPPFSPITPPPPAENDNNTPRPTPPPSPRALNLNAGQAPASSGTTIPAGETTSQAVVPVASAPGPSNPDAGSISGLTPDTPTQKLDQQQPKSKNPGENASGESAPGESAPGESAPEGSGGAGGSTGDRQIVPLNTTTSSAPASASPPVSAFTTTATSTTSGTQTEKAPQPDWLKALEKNLLGSGSGFYPLSLFTGTSSTLYSPPWGLFMPYPIPIPIPLPIPFFFSPRLLAHLAGLANGTIKSEDKAQTQKDAGTGTGTGTGTSTSSGGPSVVPASGEVAKVEKAKVESDDHDKEIQAAIAISVKEQEQKQDADSEPDVELDVGMEVEMAVASDDQKKQEQKEEEKKEDVKEGSLIVDEGNQNQGQNQDQGQIQDQGQNQDQAQIQDQGQIPNQNQNQNQGIVGVVEDHPMINLEDEDEEMKKKEKEEDTKLLEEIKQVLADGIDMIIIHEEQGNQNQGPGTMWATWVQDQPGPSMPSSGGLVGIPVVISEAQPEVGDVEMGNDPNPPPPPQ